MYRTKCQNSQLWALLNKLKLDRDILGDLVFQSTNGRTRSSKETTSIECQSLLNHLRHLQTQMGDKKPKEDTPENKMRRKIIARMHEMNWRTPAGKADMKRLENWLLKYTAEKKKFNNYTFEELQKLIPVFDKLLKEYYAAR